MRSKKSDELFHIKPIAKIPPTMKKLMRGKWP